MLGESSRRNPAPRLAIVGRALDLTTLTHEPGSFVDEALADLHTGERLPPILPVVVCHAPRGWNEPRSFHAVMSPDPSRVPGLAAHVPGFEIVVEDLASLTDAALHAMSVAAVARLALWLLRDARDDERLLAALDAWIHAFAAVFHAPDGMRAFQQLVRYVSLVMRPESFGSLTPEQDALIAGATSERLDALAERLLTATTIDQVFAA